MERIKEIQIKRRSLVDSWRSHLSIFPLFPKSFVEMKAKVKNEVCCIKSDGRMMKWAIKSKWRPFGASSCRVVGRGWCSLIWMCGRDLRQAEKNSWHPKKAEEDEKEEENCERRAEGLARGKQTKINAKVGQDSVKADRGAGERPPPLFFHTHNEKSPLKNEEEWEWSSRRKINEAVDRLKKRKTIVKQTNNALEEEKEAKPQKRSKKKKTEQNNEKGIDQQPEERQSGRRSERTHTHTH